MNKEYCSDDLIKAWAWALGYEYDPDSETFGKFLRNNQTVLYQVEGRIPQYIRDFFQGKGKWGCLITTDSFMNAVVYAKEQKVCQYINNFSKSLGEFLRVNHETLKEVEQLLLTNIQKQFEPTKPEKGKPTKERHNVEPEIEELQQFGRITLDDVTRALGVATAKTQEELCVYFDRLTCGLDDRARHLAVYLRDNPEFHYKVKAWHNKHFFTVFEDDEPEEKVEKPKKMKHKLPKDMTAYFSAVVVIFSAWGEDVGAILKVSDRLHRLQKPTEADQWTSYKKSVEIIYDVLMKYGLDLTATKKASQEKIREAIDAGIANCEEMCKMASEEVIFKVSDDLMCIQVEFMKLQKLTECDIDVMMIRKAIWKKVRQLNKKFSKVFAKINE